MRQSGMYKDTEQPRQLPHTTNCNTYPTNNYWRRLIVSQLPALVVGHLQSEGSGDRRRVGQQHPRSVFDRDPFHVTSLVRHVFPYPRRKSLRIAVATVRAMSLARHFQSIDSRRRWVKTIPGVSQCVIHYEAQ